MNKRLIFNYNFINMKTYKIYRLVDPTISPDDEKNYVRYIGWTNKTLSDRLSNHITEARHDKI